MTAAFCCMFGIKAEMEERVVVRAGFHDNIAAAAPIATARTTARHKLLTPERKTSVTAIAGLHGYRNFVNEHLKMKQSHERSDWTLFARPWLLRTDKR
jgi:hypothetical protein